MKTPKFNSRPCADAIKWLNTQPDFAMAWANCQRGDWMWWALRYLPNAMPEKSISVAYARWCANRAEANADAADTFAKASLCAAVAAAATANAAYCAADAAVCAAYAANAANAANAAIVDTVATERLAQADWIRQHVPCPIAA